MQIMQNKDQRNMLGTNQQWWTNWPHNNQDIVTVKSNAIPFAILETKTQGITNMSRNEKWNIAGKSALTVNEAKNK